MKFRLLLLMVLVGLMPATAFAYVDPGSGMLIWQGLIAVIGGLIVFARNPVDAIKKLIARLRRK